MPPTPQAKSTYHMYHSKLINWKALHFNANNIFLNIKLVFLCSLDLVFIFKTAQSPIVFTREWKQNYKWSKSKHHVHVHVLRCPLLPKSFRFPSLITKLSFCKEWPCKRQEHGALWNILAKSTNNCFQSSRCLHCVYHNNYFNLNTLFVFACCGCCFCLL